MKNFVARQLWRSVIVPLGFVVLMWIVFLFQHFAHLRFVQFGIMPRSQEGLPGIVTSVFVHGDLDHIASNTIPILVLGAMIFYFYRKIAISACLWIWLVSGLWLWIGGRGSDNYPMYHIGASTLIYGFASFLFFSGIFRRHTQLMVVSLLVVFLYGSITWGIFPFKREMSWEGHLFGALAGMLVAYNYRAEGPQRKVYDWEYEEDTTEETVQPPPPPDDAPEPGEDQVRQ